jgi:myo-inositol-1-phosphate synthase
LTKAPVSIKPPQGKLGILIPGMGAVTSTFIAGVEAVKRGMAQPIGSLTQMGTIVPRRAPTSGRCYQRFVPLAKIEELALAAGTF